MVYIFRGFVHYHHGATRWLIEDMEMENELRVPHLDPKRIGSSLSVTQSKAWAEETSRTMPEWLTSHKKVI